MKRKKFKKENKKKGNKYRKKGKKFKKMKRKKKGIRQKQRPKPIPIMNRIKNLESNIIKLRPIKGKPRYRSRTIRYIHRVIKSAEKERKKKKQVMKFVIVEEQKESIKEETKKPETFNHLTQHQNTLLDQYRSSNKTAIGYITKNPDERNAHVINKKKTFGNFGASFCLYKEKVVQEYISNDCVSKMRDFKLGGDETCILLWQQLGNDQAASLRPVDSLQGTCGIPKHLEMYGQKDMYGQDIKSGMEFQMDDKVDANMPIKFKITSGTEVKDEQITKLKTWVNGMEKRHETRVENGKVVWNGVIPEHIGKIIRDNCETLKWSVEKGGTSVNFNGLTFASGGKSRRRRLLKRRAGNC
jgi:hypothetical protein